MTASIETLRVPLHDRPDASLSVHDEGSGDAFVFMPGLSATMEDNLDAAAGLGGRYRLVSFDPRGQGRSTAIIDGAAFTIEAMVGDMRAVMDALRIDRAVVGGISMGSAVAQAFTAAEPDRVKALVLVGPAYGDEPNWGADGFRSIADGLEREAPEQAMDYLLEVFVAGGWSPLRVAASGPRIRMSDPASLAMAFRNVADWVPFPEFEDDIRGIDAPVRVMTWPGDPVHPDALAQRIAAACSDAKLMSVDSFDLVWRSPWEFGVAFRELLADLP
jgi:pimeloyl-ACP methyl ester carboxylesterase